MAITIDSYPLDSAGVESVVTEPLFAYRPAVYTVSSDDVTIVRCIADVFINATHLTNGIYTTTIEKSPNIGTTNEFSFDISGVVQDYLKSTIPKKTSDINVHLMEADVNASEGVVVRFYEVLDNGTTFTTTWAANGVGSGGVTSGRRYYYNGTLEHDEVIDLTAFKFSGTYGFLSKGTSSRKIKRGDIAVLSGWVYNSSSQVVFKGDYSAYTNGVLTGSGNTGLVGSDTHKFNYFFDTGYPALSIDRIVMRMLTGTTGFFTNDITYDIVEDCNDYLGLYWQNSVGALDYYLFRSSQVKSKEGETTTFTQPLVSNYSISDFGTTVLNKNGNTIINLTSEVVNRSDANWLSEIFTTASRSWVYNGVNYVPVIISDGNIRVIDSNDGIYRVEIELIYSNKTMGQRF